jgi:2-dehydropantoate 2-reductase
MRIKVGIVGLGAIGSVIAKALHSNEKVELFYYTRTVKKEINVKYDSKITAFPIKCESLSESEIELDWVIVCLKAHQFRSAHDLLKSLIGHDTKVAVIRNGINLVDDMTPFTTRDMILPCIIDCPVQPDDEGHYNQLKHPVITTPETDLAIDFEILFPMQELTVIRSTDFKTDSWKKLIESASIGGLQCLTGQSCVIFKNERILNVYRKLIKEGIEVAKSEGAMISIEFEEHLISKVLSYPEHKGSSMLTDMLRGNKIELEAKNGVISKVAKLRGLPSPMNDLICIFLENINTN